MTQVAAQAQAPEVPLRAPLGVPAFRRAYVGRVLSGMGSWMQTIAAGWLVYDITRSAAAVGVLTLLARAPGIPLSVTGGQLAERFGARRLELWLNVIQLLAAAALTAVTAAGDPTPLEIYLATAVVGIGAALGNAGLQALVVEVVPGEMRKAANALGSLSYNASRMIGPAIGGVLLSTVGAWPCFAVNAASYLVIVVALLGLPRDARPKAAAPLRAGLQALRSAPGIAELGLLVVAFMTLVTPLQELAPVIARRHGDGGHLLGFLVASLAAGGVAGAWVRQRLDRRDPVIERLLAWVVVLSGVVVAVVGYADDYAVALVAMFCAGVLWEILFVEALCTTQERVPGHEALAAGVFFAVALAGVTAGTLLIGVVIDATGVSDALLACGALLSGLGLLGVVARSRARDAVTP